MSLRKLGLLASGAALLAVAGFGWMTLRSDGPPAGVLLVSGRVEGDQAALGSSAGGRIVAIPVRVGDTVAAGAPVAELASAQARARVRQAEHALHAAREEVALAEARRRTAERELEAARVAVREAMETSRARVGEAEAAVAAARAQREQAEAKRTEASKDRARFEQLFEQGVVPDRTVDEARTREKVARAAVEAADETVRQAEQALARARATRTTVDLRRTQASAVEARLAEAAAAAATARARVQAMESSLGVVRADLDDLRMLAPFSGTVVERLAEVGEVVAAGTPIVTLVDLSRLHAKVYVAEAEIGKVKLGDPARLYADAFPERYFTARVARVGQSAEFTPRDVHMQDERTRLVFAVELAIDNPEGRLKPGMPVDGRIRWRADAPWGDGRDAAPRAAAP